VRPLYKGRILLTLTHTDDTTCLKLILQTIEDFDMAAVSKIIIYACCERSVCQIVTSAFLKFVSKVVLSIKFSFSFKSTKLMTGTPLNALQAFIDGFHSKLMD